jgi:hypothetical protein
MCLSAPSPAHRGDASSLRNAYPAFWGPFALIGEELRGEIFWKFFDCASQQFSVWPGSDGWSRNHDGKTTKSAAASD